jgi:flagellar biosynthesis protein FlhF
MKVKTFRARSMSAALAEVKRTFGRGAVIIQTRTIRAPGLMGLLGRQVVEVAAATGVPPRPAREPQAPTVPTAEARPSQAVARKDLAAAYRRVSGPVAPTDDQLKMLREEVRSIRASLEEMVRTSCPPSVAGLPEPLTESYMMLVRRGVGEQLAAEVVRSLAEELTERELFSADAVREHISGRLAEHVNVAGPVKLVAGTRRVVTLVGPTGVGKTTTIAKLAANYRIRAKQRVALITIDTYRIAAVQQLQTIADIIKVPLVTVQTVGDLQRALTDLRDCDLVLIDTAGRSQRDELKMNDLKAFVNASASDEVHLVVSATVSLANMLEVIRRFRDAGPNRLILSKVDEAEALGRLVTVASRADVPVSYITLGQEIPNDIEVADASRMAAMIWER